MKKIALILSLILVLNMGINVFADNSGDNGAFTFTVCNYSKLNPAILEKTFKNIYPNAKLNLLNYNNTDDFKADMLQMSKGDSTVDVIIVGCNTPLDINDFAAKGYLEPLDKYINSDSSFNSDNYIEAALNAGYINEKKYLMPVLLNYPTLYTNKKYVNEFNISLKKQPTFNELTNCISKEIYELSDSTNQIGLIETSEWIERLGSYLIASGTQVFDYNKNSYNIDSEEFKKCVDFGTAVYSRSYSGQLNNFMQIYKNDKTKAFTNTPFIYSTDNPIIATCIMQNIYQTQLQEDADIYAIPTYKDKNKYCASSVVTSAISANSKNKEAAFTYIKAVLADDSYIPSIGVPVNKNIIKKLVDFASSDEISTLNNETTSFSPITQKQAKQLFNVIDNTEKCIIPSFKVDKLIIRIMKQFHTDKKDYDACLNELKENFDSFVIDGFEFSEINGIVDDNRNYLQNTETFKPYLFNTSEFTTPMPFRIYIPKNYNKSKSYPLLYIFHGKGEIGDNNNDQILNQSIILANKIIEENKDCIVVIPQMVYLNDFERFDKQLTALYESLNLKYNIDKNKIYMAGYSLGGATVSYELITHPNFYAAAILAAPSIDVLENEFYEKLINTKTPVWIGQGLKDISVDPEASRKLYNDLLKNGNNVRYTEYPELTHSILSEFYNENKLLNWLFKQHN